MQGQSGTAGANRTPTGIHFALLATGTRGDVQPFVALGEELAKRGHHVRICAHESFRSLVMRSSSEAFYSLSSSWAHRIYFVPAVDCEPHDPSSPEWISAKSLPDFVRLTAAERSLQFEQEQTAFLKCCQPVQAESFASDPTIGSGPRATKIMLPQTDVIISSQFTRGPSVAASDLLQIPLWSVNLLPSAPTRAWGPLSGSFPASAPNRMVFHGSKKDADKIRQDNVCARCCCVSSGLIHKLYWYAYYFRLLVVTLCYTSIAKTTLAFRDSLGLRRQTPDESIWGTYYTPTIFAYSNELLPPPWDWPSWFKVTGFLVLSDRLHEPGRSGNVAAKSDELCENTPKYISVRRKSTGLLKPDLERWISSVEASENLSAPVCITFSSMPVDPRLLGALLQALEDVPTLFLYGNNYQALEYYDLVEGENKRKLSHHDENDCGSPGLLYCITKADHRVLLPRCSLVVHHGGAGTSAACLFARRCSVIVPVLQWSDQPGWAEILRHAGCGVHIPKDTFSKDEISAAIREARSLSKECEKVCGRICQEENGAEAAADAVLSCICTSAADDGSVGALEMAKRHCIVCRYSE